MKKKKWLSLILVATGLLTACGAEKAYDKADAKPTVGVLQLVAHASLDASYDGFLEGLAENGYPEEKITLDYQNAQNDQANLKSMSEKLVKENPDVLLAIATPAAQALKNETSDIPITVTAVTDLVGAKLVADNDKPGANVTGTTDWAPVEKQIELLLSIVPDAKTVGIAYNAGETNSKIQADAAEAALKDAGVKAKVLTANTTNDVQQVITSLAKDVEAIYIPTDNTFATAAPVVGEVAKQTKTPVITGSVEQVENGALATYGIDYFSLGKVTGKMAAEILDGKKNPAEMPVQSAEEFTLVVNEEMAQALGIDKASIKQPE
ncbi:ABC transporter substrate-binding protein [Enterococcus asini ATCC 700915]|uniref:ABC transporter substrate-binding protein n=1 Tax=Enterococcus asini ATCC 700915 TaxID=1158606 RepID=R2S8B9_9ENTE|nr:ABC transporter substrate-binding protein [Enterococcus asini]EOH89076.1 ABC transporter substrate-binding protein [Enterococcus asini ATCC 700915]EOT55647.1 ABC transporter substrate-binding protein [Enterococcus asini ATCC 700915]OJG12926.1 ABC transporter substrate-binding protein [Enterococcus asini]